MMVSMDTVSIVVSRGCRRLRTFQYPVLQAVRLNLLCHLFPRTFLKPCFVLPSTEPPRLQGHWQCFHSQQCNDVLEFDFSNSRRLMVIDRPTVAGH